MPYINNEMKFRGLQSYGVCLKDDVSKLVRTLQNLYDEDEIEGALNYTISRIVAETLGKYGWRYKLLNRAIGVLECAKLEFYRRLCGPYEDQAIEKNGDIYAGDELST